MLTLATRHDHIVYNVCQTSIEYSDGWQETLGRLHVNRSHVHAYVLLKP